MGKPWGGKEGIAQLEVVPWERSRSDVLRREVHDLSAPGERRRSTRKKNGRMSKTPELKTTGSQRNVGPAGLEMSRRKKTSACLLDNLDESGKQLCRRELRGFRLRKVTQLIVLEGKKPQYEREGPDEIRK